MPSYGSATLLAGMLAATQSLFVCVRYRQNLHIRRHLPIVLAFLVTSAISIHYLQQLDDTYIKKILGVTLILLSIYFLIFSERIKVHTSNALQIGMGMISGVMGGLFAMQGPPAVLYYTAAEREKRDYMAATQLYFLIGNVFMTIVRFDAGFSIEGLGTRYALAMIGVIVGTLIGRVLFERISAVLMRKIIYTYLAIAGILALI